MTDLSTDTRAPAMHDPICLTWSAISRGPQRRILRGVGFLDGMSLSHSGSWSRVWALHRVHDEEVAAENSLGLRVAVTLSAPPPRGPVQQRARRGTISTGG